MKLEWRDVAPGDGPGISTSLTLAETEELRRLAKDRDVLEIGSAFGYSTVVLAQAARRVVAVDPHDQLNSLGTLTRNVAAYGVSERVEVHARRSQSALPDLHAEGERFDLVWIDGDHDRHAVAHDVEWAVRLLRPGGVIACHDHGEDTCPGVAQALDAWRPYDYLVDTLAVYQGPLA